MLHLIHNSSPFFLISPDKSGKYFLVGQCFCCKNTLPVTFLATTPLVELTKMRNEIGIIGVGVEIPLDVTKRACARALHFFTHTAKEESLPRKPKPCGVVRRRAPRGRFWIGCHSGLGGINVLCRHTLKIGSKAL